ncbi:MAG: N-acetylmuramoyl-L-alanine amidase [Aeromonas sp.]
MSQVGKYLNLNPHMTSWAVYNENGPYTKANAIGNLAPAQFGGLSYSILAEKGNDIYVIQTESFGRCAIWTPVDNDSSISVSPIYANGNISGGGGGTTGTGKYLNLHAHMTSWGVYNVNGPYTSAYKIGSLAPSQFGGLSYSILEEKGNDVYIIQTDSFGRCAIWAPRDNDSSITTSPSYLNGNTSGGGIVSGNGTYLNLHAHMSSWGVYNVNGPYTSAYKIGSLAPAQFGGLSYSILEEKGNDIHIIQTDSFGRCAIWAPRDNDSSITTSPTYANGNISGGGGTPGGGMPSGTLPANVLTRSEWGAKSVIESGMSGLRTSNYKYIIIHHSGDQQFNSDIEQMRSIQNYHQGLNWGDIGYNFAIGKNGTIMQGRETKYIGAHTRADKILNSGNSRNEDSIGICLFGNFENSIPNALQLMPLTAFLASLCKDFNINPDNIKGHIDFAYTACPGSYLYSLLPKIIQNVKDYSNIYSATDITDFLITLMKKYELQYKLEIPPLVAAPGIQLADQISRLCNFYNLVSKNSILDLKNQGLPAITNGKWNYYTFRGVTYRGDVPGNILYGYVGKSYNFSDQLLLRAAGFAQFTDNPEYTILQYLSDFITPPYGDDPSDQKAIQIGIDYYNSN